MMTALVLGLAAIGIAGPIAHASSGWPRQIRVRAKRLHPGGRRARSWRHLWSCAMCLSFWVGWVLAIIYAAQSREPGIVLAPFVASGIAWAVLTLQGE